MTLNAPIYRYDAIKNHKAWRNIIARSVIAAAEQGLFHFGLGPSSRLFEPPRFPVTYSFQLSDDYVGVSAVQCSTDSHLLMRVNVFAVADLAWRSEHPVFDAYRPVACAESWFHLPTGVWFNGSDDGQLWVLPDHLDRLAELDADLSAGAMPRAAA